MIQSAFKLDAGQVALVPEQGAPYVIKLLVRQPSRIPPLKEIEAQVREAVIRTSAQAQASQQAQKILATIKSPADFDKAAASNKLAVKNVDPFVRADRRVPGIGEFPEVTDAAAAVPVIPGVIARVMESPAIRIYLKSPRAPSRPRPIGRPRRRRSCRNTSSSGARRHGRGSSIR